jgi:hypothetical protein
MSNKNNNYYVIRQFASGGFSNVFEVVHADTGQRYAMKKCKIEDGVLSTYYLKEIYIARKLKSPYVTKYDQIFITSSYIYFFMEFIPYSLDDVIMVGKQIKKELLAACTNNFNTTTTTTTTYTDIVNKHDASCVGAMKTKFSCNTNDANVNDIATDKLAYDDDDGDGNDDIKLSKSLFNDFKSPKNIDQLNSANEKTKCNDNINSIINSSNNRNDNNYDSNNNNNKFETDHQKSSDYDSDYHTNGCNSNSSSSSSSSIDDDVDDEDEDEDEDEEENEEDITTPRSYFSQNINKNKKNLIELLQFNSRDCNRQWSHNDV